MEDLPVNNIKKGCGCGLTQIIAIRSLIYALVCLGLSAESCAQLPGYTQNTYLLVDHTNNAIDTVFRTGTKPAIALSDETICYETRYSSEITTQCFSLSKISRDGSAKLVESKTFYYNGQPVRVDKYSYDDPNKEDEEQTYFYAKGLGVIIIKSESWPGYERLMSVADSKSNALVFYLCESIISNPSFF